MTAVGDLIGSYRVTGIIGRGAMSTVYSAHDERLNRYVALKLLSAEYGLDFIFRARFEREYRLTALLNHPNIVPVYDAGEWQDQLYIVQKLIEGPNLATVIQHESPLSLARTVSVVTQVADALDEAHGHRVVHRDVKPANILLDEPSASGAEHVYLADFGLTLGMEGTHLTRTGSFMGTLAYAAPEQLGSGPIDGRADQYALASTTFQMLTGQPPFRRDNEFALINAHLFDKPPAMSALRPDLPHRVGDVIAKALSKKPEDRYKTTGDFADALVHAASAPTRSLVPLVAAALAVIAFIVLGGAVVLAMFNSGGAPVATRRPGASALASGLVAAASPTATVPGQTAPSTGGAPTLIPPPTPEPGSTPRARPTERPRGTPTPTQPGGGPPPTPTATPATGPTPTPPPDLPVVAAGTWSVSNTLASTSGDPYAPLGDHGRRYQVTPSCVALSTCRFSAVTYDTSGTRLGTITFRWNGSGYAYAGSGSWYRRAGGGTCETSTGDVISNAYTVHEQVRVSPSSASGPVRSMSGTKTISGTPTDAGSAAGCAPYSMTFNVVMTSSE
jgi:tRNA A-37 threonylcarbamoyl transferase component Bud32